MQEMVGASDVVGVAADIACNRFSDEGWVRTSVCVPSELALTVYINQKEFVTILCTPTKLNCLVLGFLYGEGIISDMREIEMIRVCEEESLADVRLGNTEYKMPTKRTLTSGCGGGATFKTHAQRVESGFVVTPTDVLSLMKELQEKNGALPA